MLITTPEELRAFLPNHKFRNLDTMAGFLVNSEESFLRERIGKPLLQELQQFYASKAPVLSSTHQPDCWRSLVTYCQRVIVYDAFERAAALRSVSENDMGLNVAESENYDAAEDKRIEAYRQQLNRERHEAVNMLLVRLEEWQLSGEADDIIALWRQSPTYYFADGLLISTATEMQKYIDIYDNREKFIQLLPDIRHCQEVHIEAEIGDQLLAALIEAHRTGTLTPVGQRAYIKLQRTLSLYTEARSKLFTRHAAADEATGHMRLTLSYLRSNQVDLLAPLPPSQGAAALPPSHHNISVIATSPIFNPCLWPADALLSLQPSVILGLSCDVRRLIERHLNVRIAPDGTFPVTDAAQPSVPEHRDACCHHDPHDRYPYMVHPPVGHCHHDHDRRDPDSPAFLTTSLI